MTSGPYNDSSVAVFQCISGYIMSGTAYITCNNGTWTTSPSCVQTPSNSVSVTDTDYTEYSK